MYVITESQTSSPMFLLRRENQSRAEAKVKHMGNKKKENVPSFLRMGFGSRD